jgi:hypothetical protein
MRARVAQRSLSLRKAFFSKDFNGRRFHQKELFYRMPGRPILKFVLLYLGKRGFLDGRAGFTYAVLQSFYEFMIVLKTRELARSVSKIHTTASAPEPWQGQQESLAVNRGSDN